MVCFLFTFQRLSSPLAITGLQEIVKGAKVGMLTTRSTDGSFHSRAMTPASRTSLPLILQLSNTSLSTLIPAQFNLLTRPRQPIAIRN